MENKNEYKVSAILWSIASVLEFIGAILGNSIEYSSLVFGILFLCLAIMYFNKYKKQK